MHDERIKHYRHLIYKKNHPSKSSSSRSKSNTSVLAGCASSVRASTRLKMAAPHVDNPYGAKGGKGGKDDGAKGKSGKGKEDLGQSDSDSELPKCSHPFCNEPSDPTNFPIGLPWASGLLKCLPGYCTKHRKESIAEVINSDIVGEEVELDEFVKAENVCKCKDPPPLSCPKKKDNLPTAGKSKECGKPYPKYIYPDDPCVTEELCFFLRMMMVADELDRWQEEDDKKAREEAKKRREKSKKKAKDKDKGNKAESKDKSKKSKTSKKSPKNKKEEPAES